MAEVTLSHQLLCSDGRRSSTYLLHLAQLQLLRANYCSAAANVKEALYRAKQVFTHWSAVS